MHYAVFIAYFACCNTRAHLFMVALCNRETIYIFMLWFVMVALCNRADHYIFALWLLLLFFPRLISAVADWMSAILPHMVWP